LLTVGYYFVKSLLVAVNGEQTIENVQDNLRAIVEAARK